MEEQRDRTARKRIVESREVKKRLERSREPLPALEESDVDSDDEDSLSGSSNFESGGEVVKHDMWDDHPAKQLDFEPVVEPLQPPPSSEEAIARTPAEQELGRSVNGKSRRLRGRYLCSQGDTQMPSGVRHALNTQRIARKRGEYKRRMAKRCQETDALLLHSELEVPSVEALMACPLSKYIHFAANDCGYKGSRYELIANWAHPLFLKAKSEASKEDNPNWKQAMNGPFKEEYWKAAVKEIETLESMNAWEVVDRPEIGNIIDSIWAFKLKRYPDGMPKKFKARFCA